MFETILNTKKEWKQLNQYFGEGISPLSVTGLTEQAKAHVTAHLCAQKQTGAMVVCDSDYSARRFCEALRYFTEAESI